MTSSHRLRRLPALPAAVVAAAVLLAVAGCSRTDARASVAVPSPPSEEAAYCGALHGQLPETVTGLDRSDPEPDSDLTAGWGDGAIVLRCGVARPAGMSHDKADAVEVDGVDWLLEKTGDGGTRLTTTYRKAYVEVTLDRSFTELKPLLDLAAPVSRTVPKTL
ncbi:DUF3515 domain-containing protein [Streptomyces sp. NPDC047821]|uniref:DUF3515 domain-containing protein n=1 Tax=unclassified Streptomyces TaxID=2593676 RepID=UPI00362F8B52